MNLQENNRESNWSSREYYILFILGFFIYYFSIDPRANSCHRCMYELVKFCKKINNHVKKTLFVRCLVFLRHKSHETSLINLFQIFLTSTSEEVS
jgi:hypothetical protein